MKIKCLLLVSFVTASLHADLMVTVPGPASLTAGNRVFQGATIDFVIPLAAGGTTTVRELWNCGMASGAICP